MLLFFSNLITRILNKRYTFFSKEEIRNGLFSTASLCDYGNSTYCWVETKDLVKITVCERVGNS